jgi:hypothetical protein
MMWNEQLKQYELFHWPSNHPYYAVKLSLLMLQTYLVQNVP